MMDDKAAFLLGWKWCIESLEEYGIVKWGPREQDLAELMWEERDE